MKSEVFVQLELRLLRVPREKAEALVGPDRGGLRVSLIPDVRLKEILTYLRGIERKAVAEDAFDELSDAEPEVQADESVLTEAGYSAERIAQFKDAGVI